MAKLVTRRVAVTAVIVLLLGYAAVLKHYSAQGWGRFIAQSSDEGPRSPGGPG